MNILLTGAAGYIGRVTRLALTLTGHDVLATDRWTSGVLSCDLTSAGEFEAMLQAVREAKIQICVHLAALASVAEGEKRPRAYWRTNVVGTWNLLDVLYRANVRGLVFASSAAVYGETGPDGADEDAPKAPLSVYGRTKLACEQMVLDAGRNWGLRSVALRYGNVAGAVKIAEGRPATAEGRHSTIGNRHFLCEPPDSGRFIPAALRTASLRQPFLVMTARREAVRSYVHVADVAEANRLAVERLAVEHLPPALNVAGAWHSFGSVLAAAAEVSGQEISVQERSGCLHDPESSRLACGKVKQALGWEPKHELPSILASAWEAEQAMHADLRPKERASA